MRRATYVSGGVVERDGLVLGISLGHGGCAEHQFGLKGLINAFGLQLEDLVGYEARKITKLPNHIYSGQSETTKGTYLIYDLSLGDRHSEYKDGRFVMSKPTPEKIKERLERKVTDILSVGDLKGRLITAWDSDSFGIHGDSEQYGKIINESSDAFLQNDVVIDGASDLCPAGFSLLIYSRIPDAIKEKFRKEDEEKRKAK